MLSCLLDHLFSICIQLFCWCVLLQEQVCLLREPYRDITHFGKLSQLRTLHYIVLTSLERPHAAPRSIVSGKPRPRFWHRSSLFLPAKSGRVQQSAIQNLHRNQYLFWRTPKTGPSARDFCLLVPLLPPCHHASAHKQNIPPAPILLCTILLLMHHSRWRCRYYGLHSQRTSHPSLTHKND